MEVLLYLTLRGWPLELYFNDILFIHIYFDIVCYKRRE
jgi:hypothetical protein